MTLTMLDSIYADRLPAGADAYLAYADGEWQTAAEVKAKFPGKPVIVLTVLGGTVHADGCDCERYDLTPASAADWASRRLAFAPGSRPVIYASPEAPGYRMSQVITELGALGITRSRVRLLSAHYGAGEHICGPSTCGLISVPMDGTQWTDSAPGAGGYTVDASVLVPDFFGTPPTTYVEFDMARLPVLKQGDTDKPGAFFHVHRLQALAKLTGQLNGITDAAALVDDGNFGPLTTAAVRALQAHYKIAVDGIAGIQTWTVLLTGSPS